MTGAPPAKLHNLQPMDNTEYIQMTLNIGGCLIPLTVPFSQQDFVRDVETRVSTLYNSWRHKFTKRTDREILAMVAYQFANFYVELSQRVERANDIVAECRQIVDNMESPAES